MRFLHRNPPLYFGGLWQKEPNPPYPTDTSSFRRKNAGISR